ncbi:hypothetical protein BURCENBC7_AP1539 [Burkholderia cenocepacia BC7]|nr:hypothetical protein BURCENK562V_C7597 [Burkholderia cenocepacia K56-2Valvano]ERI31344.1 hypothetical protein BURCENBC7_AP1539 [Burkholderia cenocepacia BC7]
MRAAAIPCRAARTAVTSYGQLRAPDCLNLSEISPIIRTCMAADASPVVASCAAHKFGN